MISFSVNIHIYTSVSCLLALCELLNEKPSFVSVSVAPELKDRVRTYTRVKEIKTWSVPFACYI